jgi:glycosyltransferase involved in cell wall biosynthesis
MIESLPSIIAAKPDVRYLIVGATHPHLVAQEGEAYRERLKARAMELGVADHIHWVNRFVSHGELMDYLAATDIYVTPYLNPAQITSGTLSYALALGKAIVSTPYIHAVELLEGAHGVLVDFEDSKSFAREITRLLLNSAQRNALRGKAYARGRSMIWSCFAERSLDVLKAIVPAERSDFAKQGTRPLRAASRLEGSPADLHEEVA